MDASLVGSGLTGDATAPSPVIVSNPARNDNSITLNWTAATDNVGVVAYRVTRDGQTITFRNATSSRSYKDQQLTSGTSYAYAVVAIDQDGNESAPGSLTVSTTGQPPVTNQELVAAGAQWQYLADGTDPGITWRVPGTPLGWASGVAPLGKGGVGETTTIPAVGFAQYFVKDFTVADRSSVGTLALNITRSDGAVVYLNGQEIARTNVPFGPMTNTTPAYAVEGVVTRSFVVPKDALVDGANRLAVEVHQNSSSSPDAFMDASLVGSGLTGDATAPSPVIVSNPARNDNSITLNWTAATDNVGVVAYRVTRDGQTITFRNATSSRSYKDQQLTSGTSYAYAVVAIDQDGNESAPGSLTVSTTGQPPVTNQELVAAGAQWQYLADGTDPGITWRVPGTPLGWPAAVGSFGAGPHGHATTVPTTGVTQYFATDFTVADRGQVGVIELTIRRDDGFVAFLNGQEIARSNMPFGPATASTPAYEAVDPETRRFTVPIDALVNGPNRLAIELHQVQTDDVDSFLDATLLGTAKTIDVTPPVVGVLSVSAQSPTTVTLGWTAATDDVGVVAYRLTRDGTTVTYRNATSSRSYKDQQLTPGTTYNYALVAIDRNGNESAPAVVSASTP